MDGTIAPANNGTLAVTPDTFAAGFGESLPETLDLETWRSGEDLGAIFSRIDAEVRDAVGQESEYLGLVRRHVFPLLRDYPGAPPGAGVYTAYPELIERIHRGLLFNGATEAADGTILSHDTLPLTVFQIGVSLVSYRGDQGTWSHRLFRRDLRITEGDALERLLALLERRDRRDGLNQMDGRDQLARLAQRGIMAYAERAILLDRSTAIWRLGHGTPAPFELLTGYGNPELVIESLAVIHRLIAEHQKFLYVASEPRERLLLTIGQALRPLEYAVVKSLRDDVAPIIEHTEFRHPHSSVIRNGVRLDPIEALRHFRDEVAPQVVMGVFRATRLAPPQIFYAHRDHVEVAAHLALADSVLQEQRGFPLLIDLADSVCRAVFGRETLKAPVEQAYIEAGAPFRFVSERATRYG